MKKKKLKGYVSLKEARKTARDMATYFLISIYLESDGSYSVKVPNDKKAVFYIAIDKSGARYYIGYVKNSYGKREKQYIKV